MLRRTFRKSVRTRAARDPDFRQALLREALDALLAGNLGEFRSGLRRYVNATLGFARLAERTGVPEKSLMRMLGPRGNPRAEHLVRLVRVLADHEGVALSVEVREPE